MSSDFVLNHYIAGELGGAIQRQSYLGFWNMRYPEPESVGHLHTYDFSYLCIDKRYFYYNSRPHGGWHVLQDPELIRALKIVGFPYI